MKYWIQAIIGSFIAFALATWFFIVLVDFVKSIRGEHIVYLVVGLAAGLCSGMAFRFIQCIKIALEEIDND